MEIFKDYIRNCTQLYCADNGRKPEKGWGIRERKILQKPSNGGLVCSPNSEKPIETCRENCPGKIIAT